MGRPQGKLGQVGCEGEHALAFVRAAAGADAGNAARVHASPRGEARASAGGALLSGAPKAAPKAGGSKWGALKEGVKEPTNAIERAKLVKEQEKVATPPPPPRGVSAEEIDVVKPTGGGDSFTARIKAAQAAKAGSR